MYLYKDNQTRSWKQNMHQKHVQREAKGRRKDSDKNLGESWEQG